MKTGGASCRVSLTLGALQVLHDGKLPGDHISDTAGNQERGNSSGASINVHLIVAADFRQTTDSAANSTSGPQSQLIVDNKSAVFKSHQTGSNAEMNESVETSCFLCGKVFFYFKAFNFTSNLRAESGGIKLSDL